MALSTFSLFPDLPAAIQFIILAFAIQDVNPFINPHHHEWWNERQWSKLVPYHSGPRERRRFHLGNDMRHVRDMMDIMESCRLARFVGFQIWLAGMESLPVEVFNPPTEGRKDRQLRLLDEMISDAGDRLDDTTYFAATMGSHLQKGQHKVIVPAPTNPEEDPVALYGYDYFDGQKYPKNLYPKALY